MFGALSIKERMAVAAWQKAIRKIRKEEMRRILSEKGHSRKRRSFRLR